MTGKCVWWCLVSDQPRYLGPWTSPAETGRTSPAWAQPGGDGPNKLCQPGGDGPDQLCQPGGDEQDQPSGDGPDQPGGDGPDQPGGDAQDQPGGDGPDQPDGDGPDQPGGDGPDQIRPVKVTVVPIIHVKESIFTQRLICYETFNVLMPADKVQKRGRKTSQKGRSVCVTWHEALAGRSAEEVAAAFVLYLELVCRDVADVTIWADNCSAQNKCWALLSALLKAVHSKKTRTRRITIKYLETGHTAMSADAIHQKISKNLKHRKVEDFADYVEATEATGTKVLEMSPQINMIDVEDGISRRRLTALSNDGQRPFLAEVKVVQVRRGTEELFVKQGLDEPTWMAYKLTKTRFLLKSPSN